MEKSAFLKRNKVNILLCLLLILAAAIRLFALYKYGLSLNLNSDDEGYRRSAYIFLEKQLFIYHDPNMPTVHMMPGHTFLLAFIFLLFGEGVTGIYAAKITMIIFGLLSIYGTYKLGSIIFNKYVGLIAAFLLAIFIPQILVDNLLLTESPYTALSLFLFYFSIKLGKKQDWKSFYLVLLFYFLSLYIRPTIALFPILLFLYLLLVKYPMRLMLKQLGVATIALLLVMSPWWIRNYVLFNEFIPLSGGAGNPLLLGTYQGNGFPGETMDSILKKIDEETKGQNTYYNMKEQEKVAKERIKEWISTNPKDYLYSLFVLKPKIFWGTQFYWIEIFNIKADLINKVSKIILFGGFLGILVSLINKRFRSDVLLLVFILGYFTLTNCYYFAYDRYNLPLMPVVFILCSYFIYFLIQKLTVKKKLRT